MKRILSLFVILSSFLTFGSLYLTGPALAANSCSFTIDNSNDFKGDVHISQGDSGYYMSFFFNSTGALVEGSGKTFYWTSGQSHPYSIPMSVLTVTGDYTIKVARYPGNLTDFCIPLSGLPFHFNAGNSENNPPTPPPAPPGPASNCGGDNPPPSCGLGSSTNDTSSISQVKDPLASSGFNLGKLITSGFSALLVFAGMIAVLIVIWGGFKYLTAQGDEKAVTSARGTITGAVVGLIIILSLAVIGFIINSVLKINIFNAS